MEIFLGPRPGRKSFDTLAGLKLTHCCTLLSERENLGPVETISRKLGCEWLWLPIEGGRLEVLRETDLAGHIARLAAATNAVQSPRVYFHCSAGIHRTGFFVYFLLRLRGLDRTDALAELTRLRPVTADQIGEERVALADKLLPGLTPQ